MKIVRQSSPPDWICLQLGPREHYAVPRMVHAQGRLRRLLTDVWVRRPAAALLSRCPVSAARRLAGRRCGALPDRLVSAEPFGFLRAAAKKRLSGAAMYRAFAAEGARLSAWAALKASEDAGFGRGGCGVFSYDTTALELFQWAAKRGFSRVLGQMDPAAVEADLVREESRLWPGWQDTAADIPDSYQRRREEEWSAATRIVVNSEFCRSALLAQGVPEDRLAVIPLTFDMANPETEARPRGGSGPLRVLFLGQVNIRKGVPWLIEAARMLPAGTSEITIAGPVQVSESAWRGLPANTRVVGPVPRVEAERLYRSSDVFVLPTISDGFAITQLEALAHGLPLIVTPNCGDAVRHGVDGLRVPIRDPGALADAIRRFADDRSFLEQASRAAQRRARDFSLDAVSSRWMSLPEFQMDITMQP